MFSPCVDGMSWATPALAMCAYLRRVCEGVRVGVRGALACVRWSKN